jgi:hypothetical protein
MQRWLGGWKGRGGGGPSAVAPHTGGLDQVSGVGVGRVLRGLIHPGDDLGFHRGRMRM